jgi:hypothetical protein
MSMLEKTREPVVNPTDSDWEPFCSFDPTLAESFALAQLSGGPLLIQTSCRRDGTILRKEH